VAEFILLIMIYIDGYMISCFEQ